jgi:hypothetical protein
MRVGPEHDAGGDPITLIEVLRRWSREVPDKDVFTSSPMTRRGLRNA